jgi:hypothetical protein
MDSTAYRYLIQDLQKEKNQSYSALPASFVQGTVCLTEGTIADCLRFLAMISGPPETARMPHPAILDIHDNAFSGLFRLAHVAVIEVMSGKNPDTHQFRSAGRELCRLLCFCVQGDKTPDVFSHDVASAAMHCFLLEAMVSAGWCDDSTIKTTKRSAHAVFLAFRKGLRLLESTMRGTVLGYLWCAWVLAQKTEGISASVDATCVPGVASVEWGLSNEAYSYFVKKALSPARYFLLNRGCSGIAHPFGRFELDNVVGLMLHANGEKICPTAPPLVTDIHRPKAAGIKFVYSCTTAAIPSIAWTAVFLWKDATVYRIDSVKIRNHGFPTRISGELTLENNASLRLSGPDWYFGEGRENTIVRFIENPLDFHPREQKANGVSIFASDCFVTAAEQPLRLTCAWARGKGITDVNEIRLLGIYD